jgi:glycosyltransferase involved in cell wall biosynthesis
MIYILVNDYNEQAGVINGGAQSARNLLAGLAELGTRFTLVSSTRVLPGGHAGAVTRGECRFGPIYQLHGFPKAVRWRDERLYAVLRPFLAELPGGIFHLIEANAGLGTWLWALEGLPFRTIVTGLDFMWICGRSHLLRADSSICSGPRSAGECVQCYFDHADPLRRAAQKALLASSWVPVAAASRSARCTRQQITSRFASRTQEFRNVDALIAPSRALESAFVANGFPSQNVRHVRYGTLPGRKIDFEQRPPLDAELIIGFVGRASFDKGLDLLFSALDRIRSDGLDRFRAALHARYSRVRGRLSGCSSVASMEAIRTPSMLPIEPSTYKSRRHAGATICRTRCSRDSSALHRCSRQIADRCGRWWSTATMAGSMSPAVVSRLGCEPS